MNDKFAVLAAVQIKFQEFLVDAQITPEQVTALERMFYQAGFVAGAEWHQAEALKMARDRPTSVMAAAQRLKGGA